MFELDISQLVSELEIPTVDSKLCQWCWASPYDKESRYCSNNCLLESKEFRDVWEKRIWLTQIPS